MNNMKRKMLASFIPETVTVWLPQEAHQETTWSQITRLQAQHILIPSSSALEPLLEINHKSPQVRTHSFEGDEPTVSPLPGKAIQLFSPTLPKTLSPRFTSAPVHRDQVFGIKFPDGKMWHTHKIKEPSGLQSMGSQRVRHDWSDFTFIQPGSLSTILITNSTVYIKQFFNTSWVC